MARRISDRTKEEVWRRYKLGQSPEIIRRTLRISHSSVWILTKGREEGYTSATDYLTKKALGLLNPETGRNFTDLKEYQDYRARSAGYRSRKHYAEDLATRRPRGANTEETFRSQNEYMKHRANVRRARAENVRSAERIDSLLSEIYLSLTEVATALGVSRKVFYNYQRGINIAPDHVFESLQRLSQQSKSAGREAPSPSTLEMVSC